MKRCFSVNLRNWQAKKDNDPCKIEVIGIYKDGMRALVGEGKRQRKNFKPDEFTKKVEIIRNKVLSKYEIDIKNFCMEDM